MAVPVASAPATSPRGGSSPLTAQLTAPLTSLNVLHTCNLSALDVVRCSPPWWVAPLTGALPLPPPRTSGDLDGELGDRGELSSGAPPPSLLYPALCGLGSIEQGFPQVPLHLPLSPPGRRPRSEKKPTPEDQKDQRYLERRRRNNRAAKKSRDARRAREDQVALRAALLEHENAMLRAQVMTLREETHSLRELLIHTKGLPASRYPVPK